MQALAQGGTKSPYSQYGLGVLSDPSQGFSRGMNGLGMAYRDGKQVNTLNPASYSSIDSLTMLFDVGLSLQTTNFKEANTKVNANTANFEYVVGCFRLMPKVGVAFGILPYTNVGYEYQTSTFLDRTNGTMYETYAGDGGLHKTFVGAGWQPFPFLSVGLNAAYLWGGYDKTVTTTATTDINSLVRKYSTTVNSYHFDFGLQYTQSVGKQELLTVGATLGLGNKLGADATCEMVNVANADTTIYTVDDALETPMTFGVGLMWKHAEKWMVGIDYKMQKWGDISYPSFENDKYELKGGLLKDRHELKVGGEWVPNELSPNFLKRIHYRMGVGYATPYYNINGQNGPKEISASAGFGIPLHNQWTSRGAMRPLLNISFQWAHASAKDLITENTFRVNVGLTFNERWFAKWKVD